MTQQNQSPEWSRKFKGSKHGGAFIYTHPNTFEGRAIVENHNGVFFNGVEYGTVDEAKNDALSALEGEGE